MSHGEDRYHREHRVTPFRLWYPTVAYTIASVGLVLRMATQGVPAVVTIPVAVLFAALLVWMFTALRAGATVVDERGVTIRRPRLYGGNLVLHWPDIQGIETRMSPAFGQRGAPRVMVVLYIEGNRRYLLPHVHDRNGLDVAQEVATLRGLWTLGRGEDWRPDPETAAKIVHTRKHPVPLALVALLGAIIAFATGIVIFFVVLVTGGYADGGAPAFSPLMLLGVLPIAAYVATFIVVGTRRRAKRQRH